MGAAYVAGIWEDKGAYGWARRSGSHFGLWGEKGFGRKRTEGASMCGLVMVVSDIRRHFGM